MRSEGTGARLRTSEWAFLAALFGVCLLVFLTQEINPFPYDGWFDSQHRLFERDPGGDNYTPVAAPALLYAGLHALASAAGLGLETEMRLGALAHQLMLACVGAWIFLSHRLLGLGWLGAVVSLLAVLFIQSVHLPQAFWSENVTAFLVTLSVWLGLEIATRRGAPTGRFGLLSAALALSIALATITRAIPLLLLPGVIVLVRPYLPAQRRRWFAAGLCLAVTTVILAQMATNQWRYGRFELSHSAGLHLWNAIAFRSHVFVGDSPLYLEMKRLQPEIEGCWWWELPKPEGEGAAMARLADAVRPMVVAGIRRHPGLFLKIGLSNLKATLPLAPYRIGNDPPDASEPLRRRRLAPAWAPSPTIERLLDAALEPLRRLYSLAVTTGLGAGLLALAALWRFQTDRSEPPWRELRGRAFLWSAFIVVGGVYASNQIERPDPRFTLPYLGAAALMASLGWRLAADALRLLRPRRTTP